MNVLINDLYKLIIFLQELNPYGSKGGVVIFMTDGGGTGLDTQEERIKREQVRIVTMAVGSASSDSLENLARWSNGQTHFIPDGNVYHHMNTNLNNQYGDNLNFLWQVSLE